MNEKKIEPTDAMVDEAANALCLNATDTSLSFQDDADKHAYRHRARVALRVALNHPDTPGLFADEDAADSRPWEPLNGPVHVGDEVRQDYKGVTATAVVGSVDKDGDPWTSEGALIGLLRYGTWYVRHAAPEPPPERDVVVLVPADGHESITTTKGQEFARLTFTTKQDLWYGPNLAARPGDWVIQTTSLSRLTPGTWKVEEK